MSVVHTETCAGELLHKNNLRSFVSECWIMDVISLQMCCITEKSLAATQTTGQTVVEVVFTAALFILECTFVLVGGSLREALDGEIKLSSSQA